MDTQRGTTDFWLQPAEHHWRPRPTLSGRDHTSLEVWDEEREQIWWGDWVAFGRSEEVSGAGDYLVRDLAGESVFVVRNAEGRLNGFYNVCSHRGTKFLDDDERGNRRKAFTCPYHAWTYDLNGRLIGTPNVQEDELFDRSSYPLHPIGVDEYAGFVFVNLAERPRPLMESLTQGTETMTAFERFAMQDLRVGVRIVYEVEANWKIIVENYNECLHCPTVHPELVKVVPLFRFGEVWDDEMRDGGNAMVEGATSFTISGKSELPTLPGLLDEDLDRYYSDCVIGGPGAFMIPVNDWAQFPEAIRRKLVLELAGPDSPQRAADETAYPPVVLAQAKPKYDCLIGEKLWRDRSWLWDSR